MRVQFEVLTDNNRHTIPEITNSNTSVPLKEKKLTEGHDHNHDPRHFRPPLAEAASSSFWKASPLEDAQPPGVCRGRSAHWRQRLVCT